MKTKEIINSKIALCLGLVFVISTGCERDISDDAVEATFPKNGNIFIDGFSSGLEYLPFADSYFEAFSVDTETVYEGSASMRFDVPNVGDPSGAYSGAIFPDYGGRDLSEFDALTFYAKATQSATINDLGFGQDFLENKYLVTTKGGIQLTTNWRKYVIPIPDPSKLNREKGLFWYAEGPENGNGYSFWIDELQFEKLGTIAHPRPAILSGEDVTEQTFIGSERLVNGLEQTFNLASGIDQTVVPAASYFEFASSNPSVATVSELGLVSITGAGTTVITATLNGKDAEGSLTLESLGEFTSAPTPVRAPENVISVFSDSYTNVPVDYYNGFFAPFQTTQGGAPPLNIAGDTVINYTDLNFVGVGTFLDVEPLDLTQMTHLHVDINVQEAIDAGDFIKLEILNGVQTSNETSGFTVIGGSELVSNGWASFDIPLSNFTGLTVRDEVGLLFFVSDATISNIYVDNIYYYKEVLDPTPNVDDSSATAVALPVGFESTSLTYNIFGFEGAVPAIVANPDPSGINPTSTVLESLKSNGAQFYAGNVLDLDEPIDFSTSQKIRIKVWSPKGGIPIRMALETAGGGNQIFVDATVISSNEWVELEFDFNGVYNSSLNYERVIVFFEFIDGVPGDGSTYYYDDLQILN